MHIAYNTAHLEAILKWNYINFSEMLYFDTSIVI